MKNTEQQLIEIEQNLTSLRETALEHFSPEDNFALIKEFVSCCSFVQSLSAEDAEDRDGAVLAEILKFYNRQPWQVTFVATAIGLQQLHFWFLADVLNEDGGEG